jgi:Sulfotransferase family
MIDSRYGIVLGCPRSGTTFLLEALSACDNTEALAGRVFPAPLVALYAARLDGDSRAAMRFSFALALDEQLRWARQSRAEAVAAGLRRHAGLREALAGAIGRRRVNAIVFKEPFLAFAPDVAADAIPSARLVLIHRDGRDAADSMVRTYGVLSDEHLCALQSMEVTLGRRQPGDNRWVPWWVSPEDEQAFLAASQYVRAAWLWRELVRRATRFAERDEVTRERVLEVRYEDLMHQPVEVGLRVFDHLRLRPNRRVLRRLRRAHTGSIGIHGRRPGEEVEAATMLARQELVELTPQSQSERESIRSSV